MPFYGMIWYGIMIMVMYGAVLFDMLWYLYSIVFVRYGIVWYGKYGMVSIVWYCMIWYDMVNCGIVWYALV